MSGLCYRCEHRAKFLEDGIGYRYECKQPDMAVVSCYMYRPVSPHILERNSGDERPEFAGAMIAARMHSVGIAEVELSITEVAKNQYSFNTKVVKNDKKEEIQ